MDYKLGGTVMGDRTIEGVGNMIFEDLTNNVKCVIFFNTFKKTGWWTVTESGKKDEFYGIIYRTIDPINPITSYKNYYVKGSADIKDLSRLDKEISEKICDVKGSWLKQITIDEQIYWDIDNDKPLRQVPMTGKS